MMTKFVLLLSGNSCFRNFKIMLFPLFFGSRNSDSALLGLLVTSTNYYGFFELLIFFLEGKYLTDMRWSRSFFL